MDNEPNRAQKLAQKIAEVKNSNQLPKANPGIISPTTIVIELAAGVIIGAMTGFFLDKIFNIKPLFLIVCLLLGVAGSYKNIWQKFNNRKNGS